MRVLLHMVRREAKLDARGLNCTDLSSVCVSSVVTPAGKLECMSTSYRTAEVMKSKCMFWSEKYLQGYIYLYKSSLRRSSIYKVMSDQYLFMSLICEVPPHMETAPILLPMKH